MCTSGTCRSMNAQYEWRCKLLILKTSDNFRAFQILKGPTKGHVENSEQNARNFYFVTTRHLEEEPVLRSHKFNRFEQQKLWNLAIKTKMVMQINRSSFLD